jgi:hypothetical protein
MAVVCQQRQDRGLNAQGAVSQGAIAPVNLDTLRRDLAEQTR